MTEHKKLAISKKTQKELAYKHNFNEHEITSKRIIPEENSPIHIFINEEREKAKTQKNLLMRKIKMN